MGKSYFSLVLALMVVKIRPHLQRCISWNCPRLEQTSQCRQIRKSFVCNKLPSKCRKLNFHKVKLVSMLWCIIVLRRLVGFYHLLRWKCSVKKWDAMGIKVSVNITTFSAIWYCLVGSQSICFAKSCEFLLSWGSAYLQPTKGSVKEICT